jgi:hypothetical protein
MVHAMHSTPDTSWLERFAARLLRLMPELDAVEAVRIATRQYARSAHIDPAEAADVYAADAAPGDV